MVPALLILFYLLASALIVFFCNRFKWMNNVGAILWAYGIGLVIGSLHLLPEGSVKVQSSISDITVPLAIPLLLFSLDFKRWVKLARVTFLSMLTALAGVIIAITIGFFIFRAGVPDANKVAGMLSGVYTGGTPNMFALKTALSVDNNLFILTQTYDMVICAVYLMLLISVGQRLFHLVLPRFKKTEAADKVGLEFEQEAEFDSFTGFFRKDNFWPATGALGVAAIIMAIGVGAMELTPRNSKMIVVILTITTLGLGASFIPKINQIKKSFQLGMYLIVVFSMAIASMADIKMLFTMTNGLFFFVFIAVFGSLVIQVFLSRLLKIDADTTIITSTAFVFSPPFVPVVAGALKNKEVIISGITVGLIGYAIGNYLGVTLSYVLGLMM
ncbi:MAG: DUF819 family protein [Porphyromonadaceae bacterium]|nr:MAG: DUF819 family protein [Porphyromonadaceae bacterium]